jgi:hypothetical protein
MRASDRQQLEERYRGLSNEEILSLAADPDSLNDDAKYVLGCELRSRHLGEKEILPYQEEHFRKVAKAAERSRDAMPSGILHLLLGPLLGSFAMFLYKSLRGTNRSEDASRLQGNADERPGSHSRS